MQASILLFSKMPLYVHIFICEPNKFSKFNIFVNKAIKNFKDLNNEKIKTINN